MEIYENPIEHACDIKVGSVYFSENGEIPPAVEYSNNVDLLA